MMTELFPAEQRAIAVAGARPVARPGRGSVTRVVVIGGVILAFVVALLLALALR